MRSGTINLSTGLFLGDKELSRMNSFHKESQLMLMTKRNQKGLFDLRTEGFGVEISGNILSLSGTPSIMGFDVNENYIVYDQKRSLQINASGYIYIEANKYNTEVGTITISTTGDVVGINTEFTKILRNSSDGRISRIKVNNVIYNVLSVVDDTHLTISNPPALTVNSSTYSIVGTYSPYVSNNTDLYTYNGYKLGFSTAVPNESTQFCIGKVIYSSNTSVSFSWGQKRNSIINTTTSHSTFDTEISTADELLTLSTFTEAVNVVIKRGIYNITLKNNLDRINIPTNIKYLYAEPGTLINVSFSDIANYTHSVFYFNGNDCKVENLHLSSSNVTTNVASGIRGVKGSVVNCSVNNISRGFVDCNNISNCSVTNAGYITTTSTTFEDNTNLVGSFVQCNNIYNCKATLSKNTLAGFINCNDLINCTVEGIYGDGFLNCTDLTTCSCTGEPSTCYNNCNRLLSCSVLCTKTSDNLTTSDYLFKFCYNIISPYIVYTDNRTSAISVTGFYSCHNIVNASVDINVSGTSIVIGGKYVINISNSKFTLTTGEGYVYGLIGENNSYNDLVIDCTIVLNNGTSTQQALGVTYSKRVRGNKIVVANTNYAKGYNFCYPSSVISAQVSSTSVGGFNESNIPGETSQEGSGGDSDTPTTEKTRLIRFNVVEGTADLGSTPPFEVVANDTTLIVVDGSSDGATEMYFNYKIKSISVQQSTGENAADYPQAISNGTLLETTWKETKGDNRWSIIVFKVEFEEASPVTSTLIKFKNEG